MIGYDAGKKVKGRKRHLVVDVEGFPIELAVHAASVQDRDGAPAVILGGAGEGAAHPENLGGRRISRRKAGVRAHEARHRIRS